MIDSPRDTYGITSLCCLSIYELAVVYLYDAVL